MRIILSLIIMTATVVCSLSAFGAISYTVASGATEIIDEQGVCRKVTNSHASGLSIFVPTKTLAEWQSFIDYPPAGVSLGTCGPSLVAYQTQPGTSPNSEYTASIPLPAGAAAGDIAILFDRVVDSSSNPTTVIPSGWTQITGVSQTSGTRRANIRISYKKLVSGDLGGSITTMSGGGQMRKLLLVFRLSSGSITTVTPGSWAAVSSDSDPSAQTVTASSGTTPLIVFGFGGTYGGDTLHNFTFSLSPDGTLATDNSEVFVTYKVMAGSPANVTVDIPDTGDAVSLVSGYLTLQ